MKFALAILNALVIVAGSCSGKTDTLPFFNTADFSPEWISKDSQDYQNIHKIPEFSFSNQDGSRVTEKTIEGKIAVADFFFTSCPGICPRLTKNMGTVQATFKDDSTVLLLSYSVTPDIDSIARLKEYAIGHKIQSGRWHLLTGDRKEIYTLARKGYFADEETGLKKSDAEFLHTENFILIDTQRRIRGIYNGTNPAEMERLIEDIKVLKRETQE